MELAPIIVYGGFALFILFLVWASMYYAGGGHYLNRRSGLEALRLRDLMKATYLFTVLCIALACLPIVPTSAQQPSLSVAPTITRCDVEAYLIDHDTTNVRSGPGKTFKTVGNLPNQKVDGIRVHITGATGDWMRIDQAVEEGGDQETVFFQGAGWVYTRLLGLSGMAITNGGTDLYQQMTEKSRVVIKVPGGDDAITIKGCRGKWLYVEYKKKIGWAAPNTLCANSLTTCV